MLFTNVIREIAVRKGAAGEIVEVTALSRSAPVSHEGRSCLEQEGGNRANRKGCGSSLSSIMRVF